MSDDLDGRIRSIVIAGGGTAGWMSAAYLNRALGPDVHITLVESSDVPTVGVGEATIPTLINTLRFLGIEEDDFLRATNGSFKAAIKFVNWAHGPKASAEDAFYHPFYQRHEPTLLRAHGLPYFPVVGEGFSSAFLWMKQKVTGDPKPFAYMSSPIPALCDQLRFGKTDTGGVNFPLYAYHLDAGLFAQLLKSVCVERGVRHHVAHIKQVELSDDGAIQGLRIDDSLTLKADLFVDCTGFLGLLINKALGVKFLSDSKYLPCDAAVAIGSKTNPERDGLRPFTTSTALSAGWSWNVPLMHRDGNGYVYCSDFIDRDQAETELRALIGEGADDMAAKHLRMRIGRTEELWHKNCVSVGLSSNFIEPLESTAIFLIELQLATLVRNFPTRALEPQRRSEFNRVITKVYEQLRDFIVLHYVTTHREDTEFWKRMQHDAPRPDSLQAILEGYTQGILPTSDWEFHLFRERNYLAILDGMDRQPTTYPAAIDFIADEAQADVVECIRRRTSQLLETTPRHYDYLKSLHLA